MLQSSIPAIITRKSRTRVKTIIGPIGSSCLSWNPNEIQWYSSSSIRIVPWQVRLQKQCDPDQHRRQQQEQFWTTQKGIGKGGVGIQLSPSLWWMAARTYDTVTTAGTEIDNSCDTGIAERGDEANWIDAVRAKLKRLDSADGTDRDWTPLAAQQLYEVQYNQQQREELAQRQQGELGRLGHQNRQRQQRQLELQSELFDAWISFQRDLVQSYHEKTNGLAQQLGQLKERGGDNVKISSPSSSRQVVLLNGMLVEAPSKAELIESLQWLSKVQAAVEYAHTLLEHMEPSFSVRGEFSTMPAELPVSSMENSYDNQNNNANIANSTNNTNNSNTNLSENTFEFTEDNKEPLGRRQPPTTTTATMATTVAAFNTTSIRKPSLTLFTSLSSTFPSNRTATQSSSLPSSSLRVDDDLTNKCNHVLHAWALASRAGFEFEQQVRALAKHQEQLGFGVDDSIWIKRRHASSICRGIPQRAQYLLQRMESSFRSSLILLQRHQQQRQPQLPKLPQIHRVVCPTSESYMSVINAWGYSRENLRGARAQRVFNMLMEHNKRNKIATDSSAHRSVIRAWSHTSESDSTFNATGYLRKMILLVEQGNIDMEPTLDDYKVVLRSWITSMDRTAPEKAQSVLQYMDFMYNKGLTMIRPDLECYRLVLITASTHPILSDLSTEVVDKVLFQMRTKSFIVPDSLCFGAAIRTWKNFVLANSTATKTNATTAVPSMKIQNDDAVIRGISRVVDLLTNMKLAHKQTSNQSVQATVEHINDVLEALSHAPNQPRGWKNEPSNTSQKAHIFKRFEFAEKMLTDMEQDLLEKYQRQQHQVGSEENTDTRTSDRIDVETIHSYSSVQDSYMDDFPQITANSYRLTINVWKTANSNKKIHHAKAILIRFLENYVTPQTNTDNSDYKGFVRDVDDIVAVFNAYIDVCASATSKSEADGMSIVQDALSAIQMMNSIASNTSTPTKIKQKIQPNAATYASLIQLCGNVLPMGSTQRNHLIESIFTKCCNNGLVDNSVLTQLREAVSNDQYNQMVVAFTETDNHDKALRLVPESWTARALRGRVITNKGRNTKPLSSDGRLVVTKAMLHFRYRRLRDSRNRNLLEGGRLEKEKETTEEQGKKM